MKTKPNLRQEALWTEEELEVACNPDILDFVVCYLENRTEARLAAGTVILPKRADILDSFMDKLESRRRASQVQSNSDHYDQSVGQ
jgi:hypothetical protein